MDAFQTVADFVGLVLATAVGWYVISVLYNRDRRETQFLQRLFLLAVALRVTVAVGTYAILPYGYLAPDELGYVRVATALMNRGHLDLGQALGGQGWQYFNLFLFQLGGVNLLLPRLWNCVVGAVAPIMCYSLARKLGSGFGAKWSAILVGVFPSLVLWSSLNLKDADVWVLILGAMLLAIGLQASFRMRYAVALLLTLVALAPLRLYAVVALLVAVVVSMIASSPAIRGLLSRPGFASGAAATFGTVVALSVIFIVVFPDAAQWAYRSVGLARLATIRMNFSLGAGSAISPAPGLDTLNGTLAFLPTGLVDFFLRPFPWESGSSILGVTRPEMVLYYASLPLAIAGVAYSLKTSLPQALPPVAFLMTTGVGYALVLSNLGTIYRERDQLIVVMFAFVGVGIYAVGLLRSKRGGLVGAKADPDLPHAIEN